MKKIFKIYRKWMGYVLYGIILMLVLLIYRFPSDSIKEYIQTAVNSRNPDLSVTIEKASLAFPFHLKFTGVDCHMQGDPSITVFKIKEIVVRPSIWSLFTKNQTFRFACNAYDGTITGNINLQKNGEITKFVSSIELKNIKVNDDSPMPAFIKDYIGGILEGTVKYSGEGLYDNNGSGEASLTLSKGAVKLGTPILNIKAIDFKEVVIKADLKNQVLNIPNLNLKGDNFLGQASGAITFRNPLNKSLIGFNASIEPTSTSVKTSTGANDAMALLRQSLKNGKLLFTLQGTIEEPVFRLK
jgi:type II secretion system protein N